MEKVDTAAEVSIPERFDQLSVCGAGGLSGANVSLASLAMCGRGFGGGDSGNDCSGVF